jgi:hypothetical protein
MRYRHIEGSTAAQGGCLVPRYEPATPGAATTGSRNCDGARRLYGHTPEEIVGKSGALQGTWLINLVSNAILGRGTTFTLEVPEQR